MGENVDQSRLFVINVKGEVLANKTRFCDDDLDHPERCPWVPAILSTETHRDRSSRHGTHARACLRVTGTLTSTYLKATFIKAATTITARR